MALVIGAMPSSPSKKGTMGWRSSVLTGLRERNRRESAPFQELMALNNRLAEQNGALQVENSRLTFLTERLRNATGEVHSGGTSLEQAKGNESVLAEVSALEKKLFRVQEELTEMHRRKGENAQKIIDQAAVIQSQEKTLGEKEADLKGLLADLQRAKDLIGTLKAKLADVSSANQLLKDEYQALQLECTTKSGELLDALKLNSQMEAKILQLKEREVHLLNLENEIYMKRNQDLIRQQLEDAAKDASRAVPTTAATSSPSTLEALTGRTRIVVGQEALEAMPVVCDMVRIPNRAYLKFLAHEGEVNAVRWSPSGLHMASGGSDRKIKLWDVARGEANLCRVLSGSNSTIMSIDYDSAGIYLLAASYGDFACRVWSVEDQKLRHTFTGHTKEVISAKFLYGDCQKFVSSSHDRTLRIWDLCSKACVQTKFAGSMSNDVVCLDNSIISGHFDKTVKFWDVRKGNTPGMVVQVFGRVTSLDISKNGFWILACTKENIIRLLDARMGNEVKSFSCDGSFSVGSEWTRAVFSPDSEYVTCGSADGSIFIWNINNSDQVEKRLTGQHESTAVSVAWQPSGNCLTSCDRTKSVVVWAEL